VPKARKGRLFRIVIVAAGVVVALLVALLLVPLPPEAPPPPPPTPPRVERPKPVLQADAEGYYVPGYRFQVDRFRFVRLTLRPDAVATFAEAGTGTEYAAYCDDARITPTVVHLRCDFRQVGTVTVEGRFLVRLATQRLDAPVLSAVVTVRSGSGEVLYSARDSFAWHPVGGR
jgi:hypothetical protein